MSTFLWLLLALLAILFLLFVAALLTPVKLDFLAYTSPKWRIRIAARFFGGFTPPIQIHDSDRRDTKRKDPEQAKRKSRKKPSRPTKARIVRIFAAAPQLLRGLLKPIHLQRLDIVAEFGLEDPADTGQVYGAISAALHAIPRKPAVSIDLRPDFHTARATANIKAEVSFIPAAFVSPAARFAWRAFGPRP